MGIFQCPQCGVFFDFKSHLTRHLSRKTSCSKTEKKPDVAKQKFTKNLPEKPKTPPLSLLLQETITNEADLINLLNPYGGNSNLCSYCGKVFNNSYNCEKHTNTCPNKEYVSKIIHIFIKREQAGDFLNF